MQTLLVFLAILFSPVLLAIFYFGYVIPKRYRRVDLLPGPPKHWLYGTMHHTRKGADNYRDHLVLTKKYGGLVRLWRGFFFPIVAIYHANEAKEILKNSHPKSAQYQWSERWLGTGLLTATTLGGLWLRKRRMITPAFHFNILQRYIPIFGDHAERLVNMWEKDADEGNVVDIVNNITTTALDIIGKCAFGYDFHALEEGRDRHPYVRAIYACTDLIYDRAFQPLLYSDFLYYKTKGGKAYIDATNIIHDFADRVVAERRAALSTQSGRELLESGQKLDFVDILLTSKDENGNDLSDKEIRDECNTFIFEGHDTTSAALSWSFYLLATHPDVEAKVLDEIHQVIGDKPYPSFEDLKNLKYLEMCLKEALRLYPSVPTIARSMTEDTQVGKHVIPKGTDVYIHPYIIHRQEDCWENPFEFIPERHVADEGAEPRNAYALVPFSAGPRNCIGQKFAILEELCIVAMVLRKLKLSVIPDQKIDLFPALISRPEFGIKVKFERR